MKLKCLVCTKQNKFGTKMVKYITTKKLLKRKKNEIYRIFVYSLARLLVFPK